MSTPDWTSVKQHYPGALRKAYLDSACRGLPAPETQAAVEGYCRLLREGAGPSATGESIRLLEMVGETRSEAARLIGATAEEIALVESTTHGLQLAAASLDLRRGDKVVCTDLEFLGVTLPWQALAARGVRLAVVPHRAGRVEVADLEAAMDARTRAVVVSGVQEVNGFLVDLATLGQVCRQRGVYLVVDGIQFTGPLPFDVRETPVDFLAVGGHKWLCSPFGTGFLYVRKELVAELRPPFLGYLNLEDPPGGWANYLADPGRRATAPFRPVAAARKWEVGGTPNYAGALALRAAIRALSRIGLQAIRERVRGLVDRLLRELQGRGVEVTSPLEPRHRSAIVSFRAGRRGELDHRLLEELQASGVAVSLRYTAGVGGIRVSPYFYNDEGDLERLLAVVRRVAG